MQQSSRVRVKGCDFVATQDYGVFIYDHAQNKNHQIGPANTFSDHSSGTPMQSVLTANNTCTNSLVGNWQATGTEHTMGSHGIASGNYASKKSSTENVAED